MADLSLRRIERESFGGDPQALGQLIRLRIRAGELTSDRVQLLAALGDPGAALALGAEAPVLARRLDEWGRQLAGFGREVAVRAAQAAAQAALPAWEGLFHIFAARGPHACLEASRAWLECPCRRHADQAQRHTRAFALKGAGNALLDMLRFLPVVWTGEGSSGEAGSSEMAGQAAGQAARAAAGCVFLDDYAEATAQSLSHARAARGSGPVRAHVVEALRVWAAG